MAAFRLARAGLWAAAGLLAAAAAVAQAQVAADRAGDRAEEGTADTAERLRVAEPFIELRTGPGRGYPVFYVIERGQPVRVELRRTDWFRVRAPGGQVGWVTRRQLETTLTEAGVAKTFRDMLLDDFLHRRVELGGGGGVFGGEPQLRLWLAARLADTLGMELAGGQVQGRFSGTDHWQLSLVAEPWREQRWSPFVGVGLGQLRNVPNRSLVDARVARARTAQAMAGLRWHLGERFVLRADAALLTAFVADERSLEYRSYGLGLAFFF